MDKNYSILKFPLLLKNLKFQCSILGFLMISFGCSINSSNQANYIPFTYSIDTVTIDNGEHLIFTGGTPLKKFSSSERYFHYYDFLSHAIEKVDLESNSWVHKFYMDKEGPNGILDKGRFDYIPISDSSYQFFTQKNFREISYSNELIKDSPPLENLIQMPEETDFKSNGHLSDDMKYLFGLSSNHKNSQTLVWIDLEEYQLQESSLDSMNYRKEFEISLNNSKISGIIDSDFLKNNIYVFHADGIDIYKINPKSGKTWFIDNNPRITPKRKKGNYPKQIELSDFSKVMNLKNLEINYKNLVFDETNQRFYRFATQNTENNGKRKTYLLIFNENLDLISELDLTELGINVTHYFSRKGKLYLQNIETEDLEFFIFDLKPMEN